MKKVIHSSWEKEEEESGIYSSDCRATLIENDEIESWEEAFMHGYDEAG